MVRASAIETETGIWLPLNIRSADLTDEQFIQLCRDNGEFHFEITADKELIIMTGSNPETDRKNANVTMQLGVWATRDGIGVFFGSSAIFILPNGARRIPDGAWMAKSRWNRLSEEQRSKLTEICPDFVIELRSPSDRLPPLQAKMEEYIQNGARLAWLLYPVENSATIYRPGCLPERVENPSVISGDPELADCGGRMRILSAIHPPKTTRKILECLGLPSRAPPIASATPDRTAQSEYLDPA